MSERRFRKGEKVAFRHGVYDVEGLVIEDLGPIGVNGRYLYLVEFPFGEDISRIQLPAEMMKSVPSAVASK